jgi:general secretion pathway protein D
MNGKIWNRTLCHEPTAIAPHLVTFTEGRRCPLASITGPFGRTVSLERRVELNLTSKRAASLLWISGLIVVGIASVGTPYAYGQNSSSSEVANPFRSTTNAAPAQETTPQLQPPAEPRPPYLTFPAIASPAADSVAPQSREQSDAALREARRALAVGDLPRAQQLLAQVQQLGVAYDQQGDSPQKVGDSIRDYQEINQLKSADPTQRAWRVAYAKFLVRQADALVAWKDLDSAERAAHEADQLNPQFAAGTRAPSDILHAIATLRAGTTPAEGQTAAIPPGAKQAPASGASSPLPPPAAKPYPSTSEVAQVNLQLPAASGASAGADESVVAAQGLDPLPLPAVEEVSPLPTDPFALIKRGEQSLREGDRAGALQSFRAAFEKRNELDLLSQQRLQGHLQMLSVGGPAPERTSAPVAQSDSSGLIDTTKSDEKVVAKQLWADVSRRQTEAAKIRETDPKGSLQVLQEARDLVEKSQLDGSVKQQLLSRIGLSEGATRQYIRDHQAEIDLDSKNKAILEDVEHRQAVKLDVQERIAGMVDQFNGLVDEQRFAEAEVIANRLYEMAPQDMVAQQVWNQAKMIRREKLSRDIINSSENGVVQTLFATRSAAADALGHADKPIDYSKEWGDIISKRKGSSDSRSRRSLKELEIEQKLKTQVLPRYTDTPLSEVIDGLSQLAGVNIHLDPRGMSQEGVRSDAPVNLNLPQEISLKSALTLILEPLHLTYTIKDEVLKITSEQIRDGETYVETYNVADLVIPIPNFVPNNNIGLQGLINDAYSAMGYGPQGGVPGPMSLAAGNRPNQPGLGPDGQVLAQQFGTGQGMTGASASPLSGPGGAGGAAQADFDSLIDLIVSTVAHDSWMENGTGEGEIQPFPTNLSLVISQTQRVHEEIADLLEQLRRLQDLQVTIEVRFIRLTDSFFERIGIDFDFNIEDGTYLATTQGQPGALTPGARFEPGRASATVGISEAPAVGDFPNFTVDLDIPFRQGSFSLAQPQFGTPQDVASFGFAVLSDIEAFFLINASQGDQRSNVLQAPKVTLFNGQQGIVVDSSFVPFVISVIPVVGEFAAAQQPVIVVLSEGTMLSVQAVVSDDRRYVRLTLVPFFSQIGEVREFTFEGSETSTASTNTTDADDDGTNESDANARTTVRSGTTVQLPTFQVISVSTTVSVPDGGTVLLGGIKRLREGRNEFGVPLLSKVPYLDRLFRNVGIGRETDSLMMMVTPHIIIQEEEEERLGIALE